MGKVFNQFLRMWIGISLACCGFGLLRDTLLGRMVGASDQELKELYEGFSVPLGFINHWFIIRPESGIFKVCTILIANSYFYTLLLFPVVKIVRSRLRASDPIKLKISDSSAGLDDGAEDEPI